MSARISCATATKLATILGMVIVTTVAAALLLETQTMKRIYIRQ